MTIYKSPHSVLSHSVPHSLDPLTYLDILFKDFLAENLNWKSNKFKESLWQIETL